MNHTPKERRATYDAKFKAIWSKNDPYLAHATGIKTCPGCNTEKPIREFHRMMRSKDGLQTNCKTCTTKRHLVSRERCKVKWKGRDQLSKHLTGRKKCCACKLSLSLSEFYPSQCRPDGFSTRCRGCSSKAHRMSKYGISEPKGKECDICGGTKCLSIDHCHVSGNLRGTLCRACNTGIGLLGDSPDTLAQAITYLAHWHTLNGLK